MLKGAAFLTDTRITGLLYLGLAVTGVFVFMFVKSAVYVPGDALATSAHLVEKHLLARVGVAVELVMVALQALVALWFYKLFSKVHSFAAVMLLVCGVVNAVMILVSAALWFGALTAAVAGDSAALVYNVFSLHDSMWLVANLFFGLWLLPMGYLISQVQQSNILPRLLYIGGAGYILSACIAILFPSQTVLVGVAALPATVAEFWVIGFLLRTSQVTSISLRI